MEGQHRGRPPDWGTEGGRKPGAKQRGGRGEGQAPGRAAPEASGTPSGRRLGCLAPLFPCGGSGTGACATPRTPGTSVSPWARHSRCAQGQKVPGRLCGVGGRGVRDGGPSEPTEQRNTHTLFIPYRGSCFSPVRSPAGAPRTGLLPHPLTISLAQLEQALQTGPPSCPPPSPSNLTQAYRVAQLTNGTQQIAPKSCSEGCTEISPIPSTNAHPISFRDFKKDMVLTFLKIFKVVQKHTLLIYKERMAHYTEDPNLLGSDATPPKPAPGCSLGAHPTAGRDLGGPLRGPPPPHRITDPTCRGSLEQGGIRAWRAEIGAGGGVPREHGRSEFPSGCPDLRFPPLRGSFPMALPFVLASTTLGGECTSLKAGTSGTTLPAGKGGRCSAPDTAFAGADP